MKYNKILILIWFLLLIAVIFFVICFPWKQNFWKCEDWTYLRYWNPSLKPDIKCSQADFSFSWNVDRIDWNFLYIIQNWETQKINIWSWASLVWLNGENIQTDSLKKTFEIKVSWKNIENIKIAENITLLKEKNIILYSPIENEEIPSPVNLKWEARVFENSFAYRIMDSNWNVIKEGFWTADSKDIWLFWNFDINADFKIPESKTWTIEVFEYSAKDGSEINKVSINIRFK